MIDMNMDIEDIMNECNRIAVNEFRGDAEHQAADKRNLERYASQRRSPNISAYKNNSYDLGKSEHRGYTKATTVKDAVHRSYENSKKAKDWDSGRMGKDNRGYRKHATNESSSIFDPLFDII
jgi:hypothetical protein